MVSQVALHAHILALGLVAVHAQKPHVVAEKPHIIMILGDDFGHANLGVHRRDAGDSAQGLAEAHTPTLDALIDEGVLLERHYTFKICAPSRSSLQSGRLPVHVNTVNTGPIVHNPKDPVSGFAGVPRNMTGLATKLKSAGYRTHAIGKWDVGMATPEHTPIGRGYESWLGYYQHANDYWNDGSGLKATGEVDQCFDSYRDLSFLNATYRGGVHNSVQFMQACRDNHESSPACYEEHAFRERALEVISAHDPSEPLFLFHAFHLVHTPLEVPDAYLQRIDKIVAAAGGVPIDSRQRRLYSAMVIYMDETVAHIVEALKSKAMWGQTLLVFASDNGGPIYSIGGANNHPLRGGKFSDFEGGVRANAFLSGGFIPERLRGTRFDGLISIADWYGTFCVLAGVDAEDHQAAEANAWLTLRGLPLLKPVDSVPQWAFILNGTNGRPSPLHLSETALLSWPFKLITGKPLYGTWQGVTYPNCSTIESENSGHGPEPTDVKVFDDGVDLHYRKKVIERATWVHDCGDGCLFNVRDDPNEHEDLALLPEHGETLRALQKQLENFNRNIFRPERGIGATAACVQVLRNGGFLGPFVDVDGWYSEPPHRDPREMVKDMAKDIAFHIAGTGITKAIVADAGRVILPLLAKRGRSDECLTQSTARPVNVVV